MKRVIFIAVSLEIVKVLLLLAGLWLSPNNLPETGNETVNEIIAVALLLLMLPEMMVSYEHGPHSLGAYAVMFTAGVTFNLLPAVLLKLIWEKRVRRLSRDNLSHLL